MPGRATLRVDASVLRSQGADRMMRKWRLLKCCGKRRGDVHSSPDDEVGAETVSGSARM